MIELADKDYKTVAINTIKHISKKNEHNEGIIRNSQYRNSNPKKAVSHMSNWSQKKRKKKDKEWGRIIFEDIMVKKFKNSKTSYFSKMKNMKSLIQEAQ